MVLTCVPSSTQRPQPQICLRHFATSQFTHPSRDAGQNICHKALAFPQEEGISLELSCTDSYKEVSQQLAQALQPPLEDPLQLRFTQQNNYSQQPKPNPLRHPVQEDFLLPDMLTQFNQPSDTLFYEVLDLPLPELERLKTLKVRPGGRESECNERGQQLQNP